MRLRKQRVIALHITTGARLRSLRSLRRTRLALRAASGTLNVMRNLRNRQEELNTK